MYYIVDYNINVTGVRIPIRPRRIRTIRSNTCWSFITIVIIIIIVVITIIIINIIIVVIIIIIVSVFVVLM